VRVPWFPISGIFGGREHCKENRDADGGSAGRPADFTRLVCRRRTRRACLRVMPASRVSRSRREPRRWLASLRREPSVDRHQVVGGLELLVGGARRRAGVVVGHAVAVVDHADHALAPGFGLRRGWPSRRASSAFSSSSFTTEVGLGRLARSDAGWRLLPEYANATHLVQRVSDLSAGISLCRFFFGQTV